MLLLWKNKMDNEDLSCVVFSVYKRTKGVFCSVGGSSTCTFGVRKEKEIELPRKFIRSQYLPRNLLGRVDWRENLR